MARLKAMPPRLPMLGDRLAPAPKTADPLYLSSMWRQLRAELIEERGNFCEDCGADGRKVRLYADHVREVKDGGDPFDKANLRLRCPTCNGRKTEDARRMRAAGQTYGEGGGSKV